MNYKKSLLIVILALALVFSFSCGAFAASTSVTENSATALQTAVTTVLNGGGGTVKLDTDLTIAPSADIVVNKGLTINLNGHKLNFGSKCLRLEAASISIIDLNGTGVVTSDGDCLVLLAGDNTNFTIENGTFNVKTLVKTVNGIGKTSVTIDNGLINASDVAIDFNSTSVGSYVHIEDGTINGAKGAVLMKAGALEIGTELSAPTLSATGANAPAVIFEKGDATTSLIMRNGTLLSEDSYAITVDAALDTNLLSQFKIIRGSVRGALTQDVNGVTLPLGINNDGVKNSIAFVDDSSKYYVNTGSLAFL